MSITLHLNDDQIQKIVDKYSPYNEDATNNYTLFRANYNGAILTIYKTHTFLIQGKNESSAYDEICTLLNIEPENAPSKTLYVLDALQSNIGTDEVGTGDFFGGVVVAGAFVPKDQIFEIKKLGVKDSKELNDNKILEIAPNLMEKVQYKVLLLEDIKYNFLFYRSKCNMNNIKALMHNHVILQMKKEITDYDAIIIDAFTSKTNYLNYLKNEKKVATDVLLEEKAENKFISVACASIIARYIFIKHFDELSAKLGFEVPKGAGKAVDNAILKIYTEQGATIFKEIAKINFKNFDKYRSKLPQ